MALHLSFQGEPNAIVFPNLEDEIKQEFKWDPDYFEEEFNLPMVSSTNIKDEPFTENFEEVNDAPTTETLNLFYNECEPEENYGLSYSEQMDTSQNYFWFPAECGGVVEHKIIAAKYDMTFKIQNLSNFQQSDSSKFVAPATNIAGLQRPFRKRGRPRKSCVIPEQTSLVTALHQPCRKRGRPPKSCVVSEGVTLAKSKQMQHRKRGRPPKLCVVTKHISSVHGMQKRHWRRGRPPKRLALTGDVFPVEDKQKLQQNCGRLPTSPGMIDGTFATCLQNLRRKRGRPPKNHSVLTERAFTAEFQQKPLHKSDPPSELIAVSACAAEDHHEVYHEYKLSSKHSLVFDKFLRHPLQEGHRKFNRPQKLCAVSKEPYNTRFKVLHQKSEITSAYHMVQKEVSEMEGVQTVPRKRGRPPKFSVVTQGAFPTGLKNLHRKCGRPPKNRIDSEGPFPTVVETFSRKRGRPPKNHTLTGKMLSAECPEKVEFKCEKLPKLPLSSENSCVAEKQQESYHTCEPPSKHSMAYDKVLRPPLQEVHHKCDLPPKSHAISEKPYMTRLKMHHQKCQLKSMYHVIPEKILKVESVQEMHRKRGRPPKYPIVTEEMIPVGVRNLHKKCGRAPNYCVLSEGTFPIGVHNFLRKRGRPPKKYCALTKRMFSADCQQKLYLESKQPPKPSEKSEEVSTMEDQHALHNECEQLSKHSVLVNSVSMKPEEKVHRMRGRPPKPRPFPENPSNTSFKMLQQTSAQPSICLVPEKILKIEDVQKIHRKRGRPPKNPAVTEGASRADLHKKCGRPPKYCVVSGGAFSASLQNFHRKRGRPPKKHTVLTEVVLAAECPQIIHLKCEQPLQPLAVSEKACTAEDQQEVCHKGEPPPKPPVVCEQTCTARNQQKLINEHERTSKPFEVPDGFCTVEYQHKLNHEREQPPKIPANSVKACALIDQPHIVFQEACVVENQKEMFSECEPRTKPFAVSEEDYAVDSEVERQNECQTPPKSFVVSEETFATEDQQELLSEHEPLSKSSAVSEEACPTIDQEEVHQECPLTSKPQAVGKVACGTEDQELNHEFEQSRKPSAESEKVCTVEHDFNNECEQSSKNTIFLNNGLRKPAVKVNRKRGRPPKSCPCSEEAFVFKNQQKIYDNCEQLSDHNKIFDKTFRERLKENCPKRGRPSKLHAVAKSPFKIGIGNFHQFNGLSLEDCAVTQNLLKIEGVQNTPRKRGRPPKSCAVSENSCNINFERLYQTFGESPMLRVIPGKVLETESVEKVHRKHGRPPISHSMYKKSVKKWLENGLHRKRGRPPKLHVISDKVVSVGGVGKIVRKRGRPPKHCAAFKNPVKVLLEGEHHRKRGRPPKLRVISDDTVKFESVLQVPQEYDMPPKLHINPEEDKDDNKSEVVREESSTYSQLVDVKNIQICKMSRNRKLPIRYQDGVHNKEFQLILLKDMLRNKSKQEVAVEDEQQAECSANCVQGTEDNAVLKAKQNLVLEIEIVNPNPKLEHQQTTLTSAEAALNMKIQVKSCETLQGPRVAPDNTSEKEILEVLPQNHGRSPNSGSITDEFLEVLGLQRMHQKRGQPSVSTLVQNAFKVNYLLRQRRGLPTKPTVGFESLRLSSIPKLIRKRGRPPKLGTVCKKSILEEKNVMHHKRGRPPKSCLVPKEIVKTVGQSMTHHDCGWPSTSCTVCQGPLQILGLKLSGKKRGRPRKPRLAIKMPLKVGKSHRKRGRPPKSRVTIGIAEKPETPEVPL